MRVLWISRNVPYDDVAHAGGKIHNFLLKFFQKKCSNCYLISFAKEEEVSKIDLDKYGIPYDISKISLKKNLPYFGKKVLGLAFVFTYFLGMDTFWYIWRIYRSVLKYKGSRRNPDVVILQWTSVVNQIWWLKSLFPTSKFVAIEEDVSFLKKERILKKSPLLIKFLKAPFFEVFKMKELHSLKMSDFVVLNNEKDQKLIIKEGVDAGKTFVCHPFYQKMQHIENKHIGKDVLFYGAMNRSENYQSAIWFIENVFVPKLEEQGFRFIVVGNKPNESLKKHHNGSSIQIIGFVDDVSPYFEKSLCLVAPLVMGAGVKIKVIEAMCTGLPVLTNEIGIEGIPAKDCVEYFFCTTPDDYGKRIADLVKNVNLGYDIGEKAKELIKNNFNFEKDADALYSKICSLAE